MSSWVKSSVFEIFSNSRSDVAVSHLRKVMEGSVRSRRHNLFLNKRERDSCSATNPSTLFLLSNAGFLGKTPGKDSIVINELMDNVFHKYFDEVSGGENNSILMLIFYPCRLTPS